MPQINAAGLALVKSFEGCDLHAYPDVGGVLTIGFGHTGDVQLDEEITDVEAEALLLGDLKSAEETVAKHNAVDLRPDAFSALVSFEFNTGALVGSTLLRLVNDAQLEAAAAQFARWVHVDGEVVAGLVRRRAAEKALFLGKPTETA